MPDVHVVGARVTPVVIQDPPLLNVIGVHQPYTPRCVLEVAFDQGVVGLGETAGDQRYLEVLLEVADAVVGLEVFDLPGLWRAVTTVVDRHPMAVAVPGAIVVVPPQRFAMLIFAAFEVAFLDAQGRFLGVPLHALLGGKVRNTVEYSGYLFYKWAEHPVETSFATHAYGEALDADGIVDQARMMTADFGFSSLKLKGGVLQPELEVETISALSEAFPGHPLRIDPNGAWSVPTAIDMARRMAGRLEYLEDPVNGVANMALVAHEAPMPLATNMCVTAFSDFPEAVESKAVGVVLGDHHLWGGLRATVRLAGICETWGLGLSMHSNTHLGISLAAMTQVAAVLPNLGYACDTHTPWQTEDVVREPQRIRDGQLAVTDAPGLGVELDHEALGLMHENWLRSPVRSRDDVAAMRVVRPDWTFDLPRF